MAQYQADLDTTVGTPSADVSTICGEGLVMVGDVPPPGWKEMMPVAVVDHPLFITRPGKLT